MELALDVPPSMNAVLHELASVFMSLVPTVK